FGKFGNGVGAIALNRMLSGQTVSAETSVPIPKAKHVIYLHMAGSPSQLDLFDPKPTLNKYHGKPCPDELLKGKQFAFIKGVPNMLGTSFKFAQYGQSGTHLSELWPNFSKVVDEVAVIKSMHTDQFNHSPAQLYLHTGSPRFGAAAMGSWVTYGLGSENENLPSYVVLVTGGKYPSAGKSLWGSGFLPSVHQGVQCRSTGEPVLYVNNPKGMNRQGRKDTLDTLNALNKIQLDEIGDPEILTRIQQYELAYRMQVSVPEVMDISREPQHILDLYGAKPGYVPESDSADDPRIAYKGTDASFANNCVLARRLIEKGVRFVQLFDWGWDHHGVSPGEDIRKVLPIKCKQIDRALYGLITDLKQRGLLEETLIVWGGEFGRTPMQQNNRPDLPYVGRDHHVEAFTMWMAGGGIQRGITYGETDEIGYYITKEKMHIHDLQATILHLLGMDPYRLSYPFQGLNQRLIGAEGTAELHAKLLA
ncbi:MAG TPA: DUF1501 domain-containing protein, partial [Verrucomicrobia bacterium]|nr:DUF1501 domain-containing protein [Verrucomicrobiota bacterium]